MADNQKDLILGPNEFAYLLDETKGYVSCLVGPHKTSLSQSDTLVKFNSRTKSFEPVSFSNAKMLLTIIPENWYAILKNPAGNNAHPKSGTANVLPDDIQLGRKINVCGPTSFALWPGQMVKVVKGHTLRSNQYLLARVYEADAANNSQGGEIIGPDGKIIENQTQKKKYINGQILVIKGTEVSFYIPPTGIEVIPINNDSYNGYVRDAVTLERLEYCILKNENGNKRYVYGPAVVFPEATEQFVSAPKGGVVFRVIELSKISGIYIKVIADYDEEINGQTIHHPIGEEMFITGDSQMIYYPRPEHAIINYDGKVMHHAIAIPEGEGRYIMNRLTGEITTVCGPQMYLPDPRTEVVVKRKLTPSQCRLWFPGNQEALDYNAALNEKAVEKSIAKLAAGDDYITTYNTIANTYLTNSATMSDFESNASISRGTSYTKPRTVTLDTKYDGVVNVDVWTGYAVNVVSKDGTRKVVMGPQTILLDYDQTFEVLEMSTGKPKTTDDLIRTVFLRYENNKISDIINVETKDFVRANIKVSYCVNFDPAYNDKWFNVENYVKYLCDRVRSLLKREAKKYTIEEFYQNYSEIVRNIAIDADNTDTNRHEGRFFLENGMFISDCEVLSIDVQSDIADLLEAHQYDMVQKALELNDATRKVALIEALAAADKRELELKSQRQMNELEIQREQALKKLAIDAEISRTKEAESMAKQQAQKDMQGILDEIHNAEMLRKQMDFEQKMDEERQHADLKAAELTVYANTVKEIISSISPDLVAAMENQSNAELMDVITKNMSPLAMARGESVTDVVNGLLRGTTLEDVIKKIPNRN